MALISIPSLCGARAGQCADEAYQDRFLAWHTPRLFESEDGVIHVRVVLVKNLVGGWD